MPSDMRKILIIRLSSIGDIVLTSPVIRALATCYPESELHFLTKNAYADLLEAHPLLEKVHRFQGNLENCITALEEEGFDHIVDLHRNIRSAWIKMRLGIPATTYSKDRIPVLLHTRWKLGDLPPNHTVDRYLRAIAPLGCQGDGKGLDLYLSPTVHKTAREIVHRNFGKPPLVLVLGGKYPTKRWPADRFAQVLNALQQPAILLGGPEDRPAAKALSKALSIHHLDATGQYSLALSAALVREAAFVLTHDTGLMHIAAAFQKKIFTIWGNTVPELGFAPYGVSDAVPLQVENLRCRPCTKLGYDACPKGHFKCMLDLQADRVISVIQAWLLTRDDPEQQ